MTKIVLKISGEVPDGWLESLDGDFATMWMMALRTQTQHIPWTKSPKVEAYEEKP